MPWLLPGVLLFASGGCGTIFSSSSQTVNIQSEPPGVELYDGQRVGETPVELEVDRDTFGSKFVLVNYDNVLLGLSDGGGEYVTALMEILDVPHDKREPFVQALQKQLPALLDSRSPFDVIHAIQRQAQEKGSGVFS